MVKTDAFQTYADQLGIEMPIEFVGYSGPVACRHDPERGKHTIYHPYKVSTADLEAFNPKRPFLANYVHELCHLYLAETIDSSFAGYDVAGDLSKKKLFEKVEGRVVDIWVNDLFNERFPNLYREHHDNYARQTETRIVNRAWGDLLPPTMPHRLAMNQSQGIRHDLVQIDFSRLLQKNGFTNRDVGSKTGQSLNGYLEPELRVQFQYRTLEKLWDHIRSNDGETEARTVSDIGLISDFLVSIPTMSEDRGQALALHESALNGYAEVANLAFTASVVDEPPRPYWNLS